MALFHQNQETQNEGVSSNNQSLSPNQAFIPKGMTIKGNITVNGDITIAGELRGNLDASGRLNSYGTLEGKSIKAGEINIHEGTFIGDITSKGHMNIPKSSTVIGNITADSLSITGAYRGNVNVKNLFSVGSEAIVSGNVKSKNIDIRDGAVCDISYTPNLENINLAAFFEAKKNEKKIS